MGSWGQIQRSSWNIWLDSGIVLWLVGWPIDKELRSCLTCKLCHLSPAGMPAVQKRSGREIVFARRTSIKTSIKAASSSPTIERWRPDRQQALVAITFHLKVGGLHLSLKHFHKYFHLGRFVGYISRIWAWDTTLSQKVNEKIGHKTTLIFFSSKARSTSGRSKS